MPPSSRARYYLSSLPVLVAGVRPSLRLLRLLWPASPTTPILVRLNRSPLRFLIGGRLDLWIIKEVCLDRDYEKASGGMTDGWVVLDLGAGVGEFAIDLAIRYPASTVHAFEPSPRAHALLRRNIALNAVPNVRAYPLAIGATPAPGHLDVSPASTGLHRLVTERTGLNTLTVDCWTLERAFAEIQIARCDFLKIDCEGGEYDILRPTSRQTLEKIDRICLEYHDGPTHQHPELVETLTVAGFSVRLTPRRANQAIGFLYAWRR